MPTIAAEFSQGDEAFSTQRVRLDNGRTFRVVVRSPLDFFPEAGAVLASTWVGAGTNDVMDRVVPVYAAGFEEEDFEDPAEEWQRRNDGIFGRQMLFSEAAEAHRVVSPTEKLRHEPYVFYDPESDGPAFIFKEDNNGTTVLVYPLSVG